MAKDKLTDKQKIFCKEYIIDFNATRAAIAAGYSEKGARQTASDTLAKAYIQEEIKRLTAARNKKTEITAERVVQELARIGFSDEFGLEGWERLDMKDKVKAIELLGRHTGAFNKDESNKSVIKVSIKKPGE